VNALERHPIDIARAAIGLTIAVALGALVRSSGLTDFERDAFQVVNDLPGWIGPPVEAVMQLGTLWAVAIVAVAAVFVTAFARMFVGAHFPLDVIGGIALGWSVGAVVNLELGTPSPAFSGSAAVPAP
jgi:membrane-associated phospholipid phosphatase